MAVVIKFTGFNLRRRNKEELFE